MTLGLARILVFGLWIWNMYAVRLPDYAVLPLDLVTRFGVLRLLPDAAWEFVFTPGFLTAFQLVLLGCLVWLVLGLPKYQLVAISTCVMLVLFDGIAKSVGDFLDHGKVAMLYAAWILAAFPAADALSLSRQRREFAAPVMYVAPMVAIPAVLLLAYALLGAFRISKNGLDLFQSEALTYWLVRNALWTNTRGYEIGVFVAQTPLLLVPMQLGFGIVTIFELLSPVCLLSRPFRWAWIALMVPFHFLSLFLLNIFFWQNILLILFFMTDIDRVVGRFATKGERLIRGCP